MIDIDYILYDITMKFCTCLYKTCYFLFQSLFYNIFYFCLLNTSSFSYIPWKKGVHANVMVYFPLTLMEYIIWDQNLLK